MRLALAGSPRAALPTAQALLDSDHELVRVFTQPDRPAGRGRSLTATEVAQWSAGQGIETLKTSTSQDLLEHLSDIDLVVTVGYGLLLPKQVLDIPSHGFINLHFSLLPQWRGAAPVQRAIENQDQVSGVTVFQLDEGMDTGPIYSVARFALDSDITSDELLEELSQLGAEVILDAISKVESGKLPTPQSNEGASRAKKLSRDEGAINWNQSADKVSAHIRAFTSNPGAWTTFRGEVHKIAGVKPVDFSSQPGSISLHNKELCVGTASHALAIEFCTPAGKPKMPAQSWFNGARIVEGDSFQ